MIVDETSLTVVNVFLSINTFTRVSVKNDVVYLKLNYFVCQCISSSQTAMKKPILHNIPCSFGLILIADFMCIFSDIRILESNNASEDFIFIFIFSALYQADILKSRLSL